MALTAPKARVPPITLPRRPNNKSSVKSRIVCVIGLAAAPLHLYHQPAHAQTLYRRAEDQQFDMLRELHFSLYTLV